MTRNIALDSGGGYILNKDPNNPLNITGLISGTGSLTKSYGGGFGTMPSFTADFFGPKYMGGIYGWILLAWGVGAAPSPILIARVRQASGSYNDAIHVIAVVMLCSLVLPLLARYRPELSRGQSRQ